MKILIKYFPQVGNNAERFLKHFLEALFMQTVDAIRLMQEYKEKLEVEEVSETSLRRFRLGA